MEFIEVDEVRVGQVWGLVENKVVIEPEKVMEVKGLKALFSSGLYGDVEKMLSLNGSFNNYDYICVSDVDDNLKEGAGKSYNNPQEDLLKNVVVNETDYRPTENENNHNFSDILNSIGEMLAEKDKRYGNSALKPLDIFAKHHSYGARLDEKLARVKNSGELRKNDVADIIGGLVLICRDNGWTDFSDQID